MPRKKKNLECVNTNSTKTETSTDETNNTNKTIDNLNNQIIDDIIEINSLRGKEIWHYKMLEKFFLNCDMTTIQKMVDIINGNHLVSLRFMDWFVTRYCYLYKKSITVNNIFCNQNNFNINISYKAQLKSFTKKYFDPFKRKKKFVYSIDKYNISFLTTLGQLNFFRWAITNDIISYTETNYKTILSKYDYVNSFFKKHNSSSSLNSNVSSSNLSLNTDSNLSLNTDTDSVDNKSAISNLYKMGCIDIKMDNSIKKTIYTIPKVYRNICIEI